MMAEQRFYDGATVYDAAGEKIGTIQAYDPDDGYLVVQKGLFFPKDLYIPATIVQTTDADGSVHVNLYTGDLKDDRYASPPARNSTISRSNDVIRSDNAQAMVQSDGNIDVPVYEEELVVGKRQEQQGHVRVHKEVVEEQETIAVPLRHEEVTVERVAVTGQPSQADLQNAFQDQTIDVPVMGEEAVVSKRAQVVEEVRLHKDVIQEQEEVAGTVRKERVIVDGADDTTSNRR